MQAVAGEQVLGVDGFAADRMNRGKSDPVKQAGQQQGDQCKQDKQCGGMWQAVADRFDGCEEFANPSRWLQRHSLNNQFFLDAFARAL